MDGENIIADFVKSKKEVDEAVGKFISGAQKVYRHFDDALVDRSQLIDIITTLQEESKNYNNKIEEIEKKNQEMEKKNQEMEKKIKELEEESRQSKNQFNSAMEEMRKHFDDKIKALEDSSKQCIHCDASDETVVKGHPACVINRALRNAFGSGILTVENVTSFLVGYSDRAFQRTP